MRVPINPNTDHWTDWRARGLGSSDAPVIAGESPYRSALDLWIEKTRGTKPEIDLGTAHTFRMGHLMEGPILSWYEEEQGRPLERGVCFQADDLPWARASLDGLASDRGVEAKWIVNGSHRWGPDGIPPDVMIQVQHQMMVTGLPLVDVVAFLRGSPRVVTVSRDDHLIDSIQKMETLFWEHVQEGTEPAGFIDWREDTRKALVSLHPQEREPMAEAPADVAEMIRDLLDRREQAQELDRSIGAMENALRLLLGDREGFTGDGFSVTYRKNRDSIKVGWEQVAAGYRALVPVDKATEADTIRELFTMTVPGPRVLRVRKENGDD